MIFDLGNQQGKRPAVIVPVTGTTPQVILAQAIECEQAGADVVEFRLDYLLAAHPGMDIDSTGRELLRELFTQLSVPVLITVRTREQGGEVEMTPFRYRVLLATLLDILMQEGFSAERVGIDVEFQLDATPDLVARAVQLGYTPVISHHDWVETPDNEVLYVMIEDMLAVGNAVPKLAVMARSEEDTMRLLQMTKMIADASGRAIVTIAMGNAGIRSRLEGWKYGSVATFATANASTAPGQPTIGHLFEALGDARAKARLAEEEAAAASEASADD
ncbi:type I 3-dehydroquinate dehydratase [Trueperella pecoris]|uniref:3-dehydroquinate dehydratase n=1 Tax=Trueperella pecoris TaxID=2733571 RepID=A0A7M1QVB6_9ACTO|nr:type I 3-dehydroquinate dehydratase [Trueperella pecoris]QOR45806.1 type I 3-dehydroquinate dehydratase [Trueperella pecoris]